MTAKELDLYHHSCKLIQITLAARERSRNSEHEVYQRRLTRARRYWVARSVCYCHISDPTIRAYMWVIDRKNLVELNYKPNSNNKKSTLWCSFIRIATCSWHVISNSYVMWRVDAQHG